MSRTECPRIENGRIGRRASGSGLALGLLSVGAVLAVIPGSAQAGPLDDRRPVPGISRVDHDYGNQRYWERLRYRLPPGAYYVPPPLVTPSVPPAYYAPPPAVVASPPGVGAVMPLTIR